MKKKELNHLEKRLLEERERVVKELGHYDEQFSGTLQARMRWSAKSNSCLPRKRAATSGM